MSDCKHLQTKIWEPHLAGARKCLDCDMVYNPNHNPSWHVEPPSMKALQERLIIALGIALQGFGQDDPGPSENAIYACLEGRNLMHTETWRSKHLEANIKLSLGLL